MAFLHFQGLSFRLNWNSDLKVFPKWNRTMRPACWLLKRYGFPESQEQIRFLGRDCQLFWSFWKCQRCRLALSHLLCLGQISQKWVFLWKDCCICLFFGWWSRVSWVSPQRLYWTWRPRHRHQTWSCGSQSPLIFCRAGRDLSCGLRRKGDLLTWGRIG